MENQNIEKASPWRIKRYYFYIFITIVALVLPWIKVNGNHFFLLSFDKLKLHLAFVQFDMQELYLMPFILMLLFLGIFGMTVMGGRVFCGWACPQTIFRVIYRDLIETKLLGLRKRIKNKQQEPDMSKPENKVKKVIAILIWTFLAFVAAADFMWYFVPPEDFIAYMANPSEHMVLVGGMLIIVVFLVYDIVRLKEDFCIYVCPYSRVQSVLYDDHTVMAIYDPHRGGDIYDQDHNRLPSSSQKEIQERQEYAECTACESCVTVCPTHIDIRKGLQLECINCLECVDACTTVMGKLGKESLVRWSSDYEVIDQKGKTKLFRTKIIAYIVLLIGVMIALGIMSTKKEHMLLNVNKENRLYSIKKIDDKYRVDNAYEFLLQNTKSEKMKFYFEIIPPKGMEGKIIIAKPSKPFTVVPGVKKKKIVVLRTTERLVDNDRADTVIPITIRAFALGHEDKIVVFRNSTFTYPRSDLLK
ncbi:cytochrome c oxidase accessory protein CcoG [Sulfurimonas lithotrophica]|uniref:Cytochrome c oxidase accessory protein CcoG n=1 Tax=Sulfurimonas lithotrophica TaxID=2590022 RepID=A0A5P8NXV8_9BACT|nr:cytochrome c oxidase accessory protein CcoG [Sulfurimonas lithotrophica]QFR48249.1 cytochrome c oxidase accessory protein CcoG [Sulfurimonas lithotrophica]